MIFEMPLPTSCAQPCKAGCFLGSTGSAAATNGGGAMGLAPRGNRDSQLSPLRSKAVA